jgi:xylulokinase
MLLLGIDVGTCLVKAYIVNAENQAIITSGQYPQGEPPAMPLQTGRAGQSPDIWWQQTQQAPALTTKNVVTTQKIFFQLASFIR